MDRLTTGIKALDKTLKGGFVRSKPAGIYGVTDIGKSLLVAQLSFYFSREGKVLWVDTELDLDEETWEWYESMFTKRWSDAKPSNIKVLQVANAFEFARYLSMDLRIEQSKSRVTANIMFPKRIDSKPAKSSELDISSITYSKMWKELSKGGYVAVFIDSISKLLKDVISSQTQNLPARATIIQKWLGFAFITMSKEFEVPIISIHHGSVNPQNKYDFGKPWGGQDVFFNTKQVVGILMGTKEQQKHMGIPDDKITSGELMLRRFIRARSAPRDLPYRYGVLIKYNYGYVDPEDLGYKPYEERAVWNPATER